MTAKSILVIDDMPEDREQIARLIASSKPDQTVQATKTGNEDVAPCQINLPDCMLLDNRLETKDNLNILP